MNNWLFKFAHFLNSCQDVWKNANFEIYSVRNPELRNDFQRIFLTEELAEDSVVSILETTAAYGKSYGFFKPNAISKIRLLFILLNWHNMNLVTPSSH